MTMRTLPGLVLATALALALTACGSGDDEPSATATTTAKATPAAADEPAADDVCAAVTESASYLDLLVFANNMDDPDLSKRLDRAATAFADASPPAAIAADWKTVSDFVQVVAKAFSGVDPTDGDQLRTAQAALDDSIANRAVAAGEAGNRIADYAKKECGNDSGGATAVTDACDLLTAKELRRVFPADDPVAKGNDFGKGFLECIWTGKNAEASVAVVPKATLAEEYTDRMTPFDTAADFSGLDDANAYESAIGIGRVSGKGHTVTFSNGGTGVMVAVRFGADGSKPADTGAAAQLARAVNGRL